MNEHILNESVIREDMSKCLGKGKKVQPKKLDEAAGKKWVLAEAEPFRYAVSLPEDMIQYLDQSKLTIYEINGIKYIIFETVVVEAYDIAKALEGDYDGDQYEEAAEILKKAIKKGCEEQVAKIMLEQPDGYATEDDDFDEIVESFCGGDFVFVKQV